MLDNPEESVLFPPETPTDQPSLVVGDSPLTLPDRVVKNRANRYHIALGNNSPGEEELGMSLKTGQEESIRNLEAIREEQRQRTKRQQDLISSATSGAVTDVNQAYQAYLEYTKPIVSDPNTVIEESFGNKYLENVFRTNRTIENIRRSAQQEDPKATLEAMNGTQQLIARRALLQKTIEDLESETPAAERYLGTTPLFYPLRALGPVGHLLSTNLVRTMLPGVSALNTSPDYSPSNILLPGSSIEAERRTFYSFERLSEAREWLLGRVNQIKQNNPLDAVDYVQAILTADTTDIFIRNLIGVTDVEPFLTPLMVAGKSSAAVALLNKTLRNAVTAIPPSGPVRTENVAAMVGDLNRAGDIVTARSILNKNDPLHETQAFIDNLTLIYNPRAHIELNPGSYAGDRARKLTSRLEESGARITDAILEHGRIPRTPKEIDPQLLEVAKNRIDREFSSINDYIVNYKLHHTPADNTKFVEAVLMDANGLAFKTAAQADNYAQNIFKLDPTQYTVRGFSELANPLATVPNENAVARLADTIQGSLVNRVKYPPGSRHGNKIEGFNSIQGYVRLQDGKEVKVANSKNGIFTIGTDKAKIDPKDITAFKNTAKDAEWKNVTDAKPVRGQIKDKFSEKDNAWYVSIVRRSDESDPLVRSNLITTNNENPVSFANYAFGAWFRSAEDQLAYFQRGNRHLATHIPKAMMDELAELSKPLAGLNKESHARLERVLNANKDHEEVVKGKIVRGRAHQSQAALEKEWMRLNEGHLPTEQESYGYWLYHQLMDGDWMVRNMSVHRDWGRIGVDSLYTVVLGEDMRKATFPGKVIAEIPYGHKHDAGVMIISDDIPVTHFRMNKATTEEKALVEGLQGKGYSIIYVANPTDRPLKEATDFGLTVNFLVTNKHNSEALPFELVDRNPGVHIKYPHAYSVKQPIVEVGEGGRLHYYGDRMVVLAETEQDGIRIAKALEDLKRMFGDKKSPEEIEAFIHKNLPKDLDYWTKQFKQYLKEDQPIRHVPTGKRVLEYHRDLQDRPEYANYVNENLSDHNLSRAINMDFMSERDAHVYQIAKAGEPKSVDDPLWVFEPARTMDPWVSLERAVANSVRTLHMNDLSASAIEQWAAQYGHLLKEQGLAKNNPSQAFWHGTLTDSAADMHELQSAINTRARIQNFIGLRSEVSNDIHWLQSKLMNNIQSKLGDKAVVWYNDTELKIAKDPITFWRNIMHHKFFGLFNIAQFPVQAMGFTSVHGILNGAHGPVEGTKLAFQSMFAYIHQRGLDLNNNLAIRNHAVNKAVSWGWKKEHYLEVSEWMRKDGWRSIGREHAMQDYYEANLWTTKTSKVLDAGLWFFNEGERLPRMTSGFAAYLEWRKQNPTAVFDDYAKNAILLRANDLTINMTRASNSMLQEGAFRVASQYYTFTQRMLETYWSGQRLSTQEKLGLFLTQSMYFGFPAVLGSATLLPLHDMLRSQLLTASDGTIDISAPWFEIMTAGFMSYAITLATGKQYDISGRYGPAPSDQIYQIFFGDKGLFETAAGASGTAIIGMLNAAYPFLAAPWIAMFGKQESFPLTIDDVISAARETSAGNQFNNTIVALRTMHYFAKNGRLLADDMSKLDAAFLSLGVVRRDIKDAYLIEGTLKRQEDKIAFYQRKAEADMRTGFKYLAQDDIGKADAFFGRAKATLVIFAKADDALIAETVRKVQKDNLTIVQGANEKLLKMGNRQDIPARMKRFLSLP